MTCSCKKDASKPPRDVEFWLARPVAAGPAVELADVTIEVEGIRTWAGALLWEPAPAPDCHLEAMKVGPVVAPGLASWEPDLPDLIAWEQQQEARTKRTPPAAAGGLSVLRTSGPVVHLVRAVRIPLKQLLALEYPPGWTPPKDVSIPLPRAPSKTPGMVTATAARGSKVWKRYKGRINACRRPEGGRLWYGRNGSEEFLDPAPCNCKWHDCRPADIEARVRRLDPVAMMTLTFRQSGGPLTRDQAWLLAFPMLRRLLRWMAKNGLDLGRYVAVKECHESGWPHLHVAVERFPWEHAHVKTRKSKGGKNRQIVVVDCFRGPNGRPLRWRDQWVRLGGGWIVELEALNRSAEYIAKYVNKPDEWPEDVKALLVVNRKRAWTCSRGLRADKPRRFWTFATGKTPGEVGRALHRKMREGLDGLACGDVT